MKSSQPGGITAAEVLQQLTQAGRPLTRRQLSQHFDLDKPASDRLLKPLLQELMARGDVVRNRRAAYGLPGDMELVRGRISAHADGFGFVMPDDGKDDLYLSPRQMRQVFHGDRVLAAVTRVDRRGRREGGIVEILERAHSRVVGRLVIDGGIAMLVPDDPRLTQDILIPLDTVAEAKPGQIVVAEILKPPTLERAAVGAIVAVLGQADEPGMATEIAIFGHDLPSLFPAEAEQEAATFGERIDPARAEGRRDLRDLPLLTIDGADARDFDDAVWAEPLDQGFRLIVAIADVAEYVMPGSPLDQEAQRRGTSVYFPDRVLPMLPESLSNGLCSLRPDEDRLCVVCELTLDASGAVRQRGFYEAQMRSRARLTYDQVRRLHQTEDPELRDRFAPVLDTLEALHQVYRLRARRRAKRGALDFDSSEVYFQFDAEGRVADIVPRARHDAHRLIEECMILANVEAAQWVAESDLPLLYRVHEPPPTDKLEGLETFLRAQGLAIGWSDMPTPSQFAAIQRQVKGSEREMLVNAVLLRSLSLAVYQPENGGHFGLALKRYAHFTSPIRRYPDLLLHRAIKHLCRRRDARKFGYSRPAMSELGRHCSWTERRAEDAGRDVDERLKCQFMQRHIGDEFQGTVTGVTSFGLFVELDRFAISGLVHVTAMPNDYYHFDPAGHLLVGKRRGLSYRLADRVRIKVAAVNVTERKIDLALAEPTA